MSIFSRLWRFVHINGYPLLTTPIAAAPKSSRHKGAKSQRLETMERRVLLSTLLGGQTYSYFLPTPGAVPTSTSEQIEVSATGNTVAELIAATRDFDGVSLLTGNLSGVSSTGLAQGNGAVPVSEGAAGSARPQPYNDPDIGANITAFNQINLRGISSNSSGVTYAFNVFDQVANSSNATLNYPVTTINGNTTTVSNNTLWDIQLLQINNGTGKATFIADLTNQLETGGLGDLGLAPTFDFLPPANNIPQGAASFLPDLLNAANVTIAGAAFNPLDHRIYFDVAFKPPSNITLASGVGGATGVGGNLTLNVLMSIDPTAGNENAVISTMTYGNGVNLANANGTSEGASLLDTAGGTYNITALTFQPTTAGNATMWTYRIPAGGATVTPPPAPNLQQYAFPLVLNPVTGAIASGNSANVTEFGAALNGVTGLAFVPPSSGVGLAQNGSFLWATSTTDAGLHLIDVGAPFVAPGAQPAYRSLRVGGTSDLNGAPFSGTVQAGNVTQTDGNLLQGLTWNPAVTDPFTNTPGALMSYDDQSATKDVMFVADTLHSTDLFAVYTNQSDIASSLTFQTFHVVTGNPGEPFHPDLFTGAFGANGAYAPNNADANVGIPGAIGQGLIGYFEGTSTNKSFLHQSATLTGPVNIFPGEYTTDPNGIPSTILQPGLYVGYGLESPAANSGSIAGDTLGNDFVGVSGLAINSSGMMVAVSSKPGLGDQLAFLSTNGQIISVDPVNGQSIFPVVDASGNNLTGLQGLAWGDVNLDGNEQLYAIYDLGNGAGPTLGTISLNFNASQAVFNPLGALGLTGAHVQAMAFFNHETAFDSSHQGLYIIAAGGAAGATSTLFQINPLNGMAVNPAGIGPILTTNGATIIARSAVFDANGNLIVANILTGQLLDVSLNADPNGNVIAGNIINTPVGSISSTIGAIARNPVTNQFFAVDNETDLSGSGISIGVNTSSILVTIRDFTNPLNEDVSLGTFLFDGTVTGRVFISGSMNKFYAGWLITGDSSDGFDPNAGGLNFAENFQVNGDIQHILSFASIGNDGNTAVGGLPTFFTGTEIIVGGKIGDIVTDDQMTARVVANDSVNIPNIIDGNTLDPIPQTEDQQYVILTGSAQNQDNAIRIAWENGQLVNNLANVAPFASNSFANASS